MAETRMIRRALVDSDRFNELGWMEQNFYFRLLLTADDYGLFDARLSVLRAQLYPVSGGRVREADLQRALAESERAGLIRLYEVEGKVYGQVLRYGQRRLSRPRYPLPTEEHGGSRRNTEEHGESRCSTVVHGEPRCSTVDHGGPRRKTVAESNVAQCGATVFHGESRRNTVVHGGSRCSTEEHGVDGDVDEDVDDTHTFTGAEYTTPSVQSRDSVDTTLHTRTRVNRAQQSCAALGVDGKEEGMPGSAAEVAEELRGMGVMEEGQVGLCAEAFYGEFSGVGWKLRGMKIKDWRAVLGAYAAKWAAHAGKKKAGCEKKSVRQGVNKPSDYKI